MENIEINFKCDLLESKIYYTFADITQTIYVARQLPI